MFSVISTDTDSNVVTSVGQSTQQNSLTTGFISGSITVYAKASTPIQYSLAYASSGATAMQYELRVVVAGTTAPSSTGTVSSFNGRTGAVTPGSSDYTAAQVGALDANENVAGKNFVINGAMDWWQRGTSSSSAGYQTADRWYCNATASTTFSQETSNVPTGFRYALKGTAGATAQLWIQQAVETTLSLALAGQTVTVSAYVSASTSTPMNVQLNYSTSVDNPSGGSWNTVSPISTNYSTPANSSGYIRISATFVVPSNAKTVDPAVWTTSTISSGTSIYVTGIQLEIGSTATAFSRAGGTIQGELAACQRYFYGNTFGTSLTLTAQLFSGNNYTTVYMLPVPMRILPSITFGLATYNDSNAQWFNTTTSGSYSTGANVQSNQAIRFTLGGSSLYGLCNINYLQATAEL